MKCPYDNKIIKESAGNPGHYNCFQCGRCFTKDLKPCFIVKCLFPSRYPEIINKTNIPELADLLIPE